MFPSEHPGIYPVHRTLPRIPILYPDRIHLPSPKFLRQSQGSWRTLGTHFRKYRQKLVLRQPRNVRKSIDNELIHSITPISFPRWLFYSEPAFSRNSSYHGFVKTGRPPHPGSSVSQCVNFQGSQRIQSIRHFSHANLSTPAISLFTRELSATGGSILQRELFLDGDSISLSTPISFGAYAFSGFRPWTIYPLPGFAGSPTCLNLPRDFDPTSDAREMALLSVNINVNLILASARVGCSGSATHLFPLPSKTAVLSLGDSLTLFLGNLRIN